MNDVREISDLIARMLLDIDRLDWAGVRRTFAARVQVDYTSLFNGSPTEQDADELIATWTGLLPGFDATQHLVGPIVVNANNGSITAETSVRGYHVVSGAPGGTVWMVAGVYTFGVTAAPSSWLITSLRLTVSYQEGNPDLVQLAQQRVAAGQLRQPNASTP